jgi:hypothetical protein
MDPHCDSRLVLTRNILDCFFNPSPSQVDKFLNCHVLVKREQELYESLPERYRCMRIPVQRVFDESWWWCMGVAIRVGAVKCEQLLQPSSPIHVWPRHYSFIIYLFSPKHLRNKSRAHSSSLSCSISQCYYSTGSWQYKYYLVWLWNYNRSNCFDICIESGILPSDRYCDLKSG